jgi:F-type H+-transporting ATPase subunit a
MPTTIKRMLLRNLFLLLSFFLFAPGLLLAGDPEDVIRDTASVVAREPEQIHENSGKFDAGKTIIEHITDAHDWHVIGHFSIPLPVIIYHPDRGLSVFSSGKFHHGENTYGGYMLKGQKIMAVQETESIPVSQATVDEAASEKVWDFSITKNVLSLFISCALLFFIFYTVAKTYQKREGLAPKGLQSLVEPLIIFVRDDIARSSIGEKHYKKFLPFLLTVFFFIWINNLLGLIPIPLIGGTNLTGNIGVTLTLAVFTFVITTISANKNYWQHVFAMPGVPVGILFLLTPIEILGVFLRPFVLMIRLFANITAGHIIALSFFSLIFIFGEMSTGLGFGVAVVSLAFTIFMTALELLVAFLQAYVFTLLSAIYFGSAVEEHHGDQEKKGPTGCVSFPGKAENKKRSIKLILCYLTFCLKQYQTSVLVTGLPPWEQDLLHWVQV